MSHDNQGLVLGCLHFGLSEEEILAVCQILTHKDAVFYMLIWILRNWNNNCDSVEVILAACEIEEELEIQEYPNLK